MIGILSFKRHMAINGYILFKLDINVLVHLIMWPHSSQRVCVDTFNM